MRPIVQTRQLAAADANAIALDEMRCGEHFEVFSQNARQVAKAS